jgi:hypothetical protein
MEKPINKEWEITTNRFVAFIDIMGFKDMITRNKPEYVYEKFLSISQLKDLLNNFNKVIAHVPQESLSQEMIENINSMIDSVYVTSFSDSILIFSADDNENTITLFNTAVTNIFSNIIVLGWAAKGAIAYGEMTIDKENSIYFGQPLIDAFYLQEKELNYYGIVLHNTAEKFIINSPKNGDPDYFYCSTPMASGRIKHLNLEWFSDLFRHVDTTLFSYKQNISAVKKKIEEYYLKVSGAPRKYVDNTLYVFDEFIKDYNERNKT